MPEEPVAPLVLWVGCMGSEYISALHNELHTTLPELYIHHPHYDQTPGEH